MHPRHQRFPLTSSRDDICPKCSRIVMFLMHRRHLVLPLLIINLGFFLLMYVMTVSSDTSSDISGPPAGLSHRHVIDAREFREVVVNTKNQPPQKRGYIYKNTNKFDEESKTCDIDAASSPSLNFSNGQSVWFPVFPGSNKTFVYSAYLDTRASEYDDIDHRIRIIGMSSGYTENSRLYCQIWYRDRDIPDYNRARYNIVPETHDYKYAPAMFDCKSDHKFIPYAVTLTSSKCAEPHYHLAVVSPSQQTEAHEFTVCVSPINMHYDDIYSFVENVEINRILGANKIVLYNNTSGERLNRYIRHYAATGVVDLVQWQLPVNVHTDPPDPLNPAEIHYFGQVVALNDCLYRYMYQTKYIVYTDLDEVVVPRGHVTWHNMLANLTQRTSITSNSKYDVKKRGAYMFRNTFFRIDWADDNFFEDHKTDRLLKLRTQLKLTREKKIWDFYTRSKNIVIPRAVVMTGIHFIFQFQNTETSHRMVPSSVGLLHHYRDWGDEGKVPEHKLDPYMSRFKQQLYSRTIKAHNAVKVLPEISEPKPSNMGVKLKYNNTLRKKSRAKKQFLKS